MATRRDFNSEEEYFVYVDKISARFKKDVRKQEDYDLIVSAFTLEKLWGSSVEADYNYMTVTGELKRRFPDAYSQYLKVKTRKKYTMFILADLIMGKVPENA